MQNLYRKSPDHLESFKALEYNAISFFFFFLNNNYMSVCISYSVTQKESHNVVHCPMVTGGQKGGAGRFAVMRLKSGSTFHESNSRFCCRCRKVF